jgi:hypothetical protein
MCEFDAPKNQFLVFEEGPSDDVILQWATYRDASDQCSLSRIWGGIHPPADDIYGRLMGIEIGTDAFHLAETYFKADYTGIENRNSQAVAKVYPNPVSGGTIVFEMNAPGSVVHIQCLNMTGTVVSESSVILNEPSQKVGYDVDGLNAGMYVFRFSGEGWTHTERIVKQ